MTDNAIDLETSEKMAAASALYWVQSTPLVLQAGPLSLVGREYQVDWLTENHPDQSFVKGAQIGATTIQILKSLHGMKIRRYNQGVMYLFPTNSDVSDFSKSQFKPLIDENPDIQRFVKSTDAVTVKRIHKAMLYLRGAKSTRVHGTKKTTTKLKTAAADKLVYDERDEMESSQVKLAEARTGASRIQDPRVDFPGERAYLSTPTIPDYGIDADYKASDGRVWMLQCRKCGRWTCLELEFPNCLHRRGIRDDMPVTAMQSVKGVPGARVGIKPGVIRICTKCRDQELFPIDGGKWVKQRPTITHKVGWWISQLNTVTMNPANILNQYEQPKDADELSEVYNSMLGMAYIQAENRLTENQVMSRCTVFPMEGGHNGPCGMGVDVGKHLNVVIGQRPWGKTVKVIKIAEVDNFSEVHQLAKRYGVRMAVFDLYPETRKVREFRAAANYPVYGCAYNENQRGAYAWNERDGTVTVNRTEVCDATHDIIANDGWCEIPRRDPDVEMFAKQMSMIAKVLIKDEETGSKIYRYRKLGADHYRHAMNYLHLALERTPRPAPATTGGPAEKEDFYYG